MPASNRAKIPPRQRPRREDPRFLAGPRKLATVNRVLDPITIYGSYMQTLHKTESPIYIASIRFLDGPNPETRKDALIEPLCSAYQHLTQFVFEFSILLLRRLTITRSSR